MVDYKKLLVATNKVAKNLQNLGRSVKIMLKKGSNEKGKRVTLVNKTSPHRENCLPI